MLALTVLLVSVIKGIFPPPEKNTELLNAFWLRKTHLKTKHAIVVGGDSRVYRGFSIDAMEAEVEESLKGINLGYSSAGFSIEYIDFLLNRLPKQGDRFLVLGLTPNSLTDEAVKNEALHQYQNERSFNQFKGLYLSSYLAHFAPYKITEWRNFITGQEPEMIKDETFMDNGWARSNRMPQDTLVALDIYRRIFTKDNINDSILATVVAKLDTVVQSGVNVIAYRPPTFDGMSALEDSLANFNEVKIVHALEQIGVTWVDFNNADYTVYDGSHLHFESAERLAAVIGRKINAILREK